MNRRLNKMTLNGVSLREIISDDTKNVINWRNNPDNKKYFYSDNTITIESHNRFLDKYFKNNDEELYIIENKNIPVGMIGLVNIDSTRKKAEWGRFVVDPKKRESKTSFIAEYLICKRALEELEMDLLYCEVLSENSTVIKFHEMFFGFETKEIRKNYINKDGVYKDVSYLELNKVRWQKISGKVLSFILN